jgi:peptidoglycan/xylan/chitin deacetylase (PgdA/CDA1 family)
VGARGAVRGAAGRGVKLAAAAADAVRRPARGAVVLLYHRVGARTHVAVDLPAPLFAEQVAWLAAQRSAVTLDAALSAVRSAGPADPDAPDPVVVTFDDGTADVVEVALPVLVEHRVPALLYVATDFVECRRPFPDDGTPVSWAALRDAVSTGFLELGSHTHTHALLDRLDPREAAAELDRSTDLLGERVGVVARHFAYPKAVPASPAVEPLVRERFASAALGGSRPNPYGATDPHRLARSALQTSDGFGFFVRKARGGLALEDTARRALNRRRYATATS